MNGIPSFKAAPFVRLARGGADKPPRDEEDELTRRLLADNWLAGVRSKLPDGTNEAQAARKCLELVETLPQQVSALLEAHPYVAHEAIDLLKTLHIAPEQARQWTKAILEAGYQIEITEDLPKSARDFLLARERRFEYFLSEKKKKYERYEAEGGGKTGKLYRVVDNRGRSSPHLSTDSDYSPENRNGKMAIAGQNLWCGHLSTAVSDPTKTHGLLKQFSKGDPSQIESKSIAIAEEEAYANGSSQVEVSGKNFGKLLLALAQQVKPGETRSYSMIWMYPAGWDSRFFGHATRLFLKKDESDAIKVELYDPDRTGDTTRKRVLAEDLKYPPSDISDYSVSPIPVPVVAINIEDAQLAQALAGKFVASTKQHQRLAFLIAMATANFGGMEASLRKLNEHFQYKWRSKDDLAELENVLKKLRVSHADKIPLVLSLLLKTGQSELPPDFFRSALTDCGLRQSIDRGDKDAIRAYAQAVVELQKNPNTRLTGKDAKAVLDHMHDAQSRGFRLGNWWANRPEYTRNVKSDRPLYELFRAAKQALKVR